MVKIEYQNKTKQEKKNLQSYVLFCLSIRCLVQKFYVFFFFLIIPAVLGQQLQQQREKIYRNKEKKVQ